MVPEDLVPGVLRADSEGEDSFGLASHGRELGVAVCSLTEDPELTTLCMDLLSGVLRADSRGEDSFILADLALVAKGFFPLRADKAERAEEIDRLEGDSSLICSV